MTRDIEHQVATAFASNVAQHRMIVRLDNGLYRHLVFEQRKHSWNDRFELITAPGSLTITGDRGAHTFRRLTDMFQFFRRNGNDHGINPGYWAEKLPDAGRSVKVYSEDVLKASLAEHIEQAIADRDAVQQDYDDENARQLAKWRDDPDRDEYPAPEPEEEWKELIEARELVDKARELIADYEADGRTVYEDGARDLLHELERVGLVSDTWEWDLSDWDYHFLHNLHAIAWGVTQYDVAVQSGLHKPRTGPAAWDTPLPTTAPQPPKPRKPAKDTPIRVTVTMAALGGAL